MMISDSSIKIIFFADTHLGFDYPVKPRIDRRRRGDDFFNNYKIVLDYAVNSNADLVLHGGDFFFRSRVPKKIIDLSYNILLEFMQHKIPFVLVPGNHERSIMPESIFLGHPDIFIFNEPKTFQFDLHDIKLSISGFPCDRKEARQNFISLAEKTNYKNIDADFKLMLLHQAVEGATVGPSNFTFRNSPDTIRFKDIPVDIDGLLSGHIHRQQILVKKIGVKKIPVIYPGSIERTAFAEKDEEKGFYEIIISRKPDNQVKYKSVKFIKLPARPMTDLIIGNNINAENLADYLRSQIYVLHPDSIVRINFEDGSDKQVGHCFTSDFLRELFPYTINYQFGGTSIFNRKKSG